MLGIATLEAQLAHGYRSPLPQIVRDYLSSHQPTEAEQGQE